MTEPYPELPDAAGSPDAPAAVTPDLLEYASEEDLLQLALDYCQAALPEWSPRAGNTEVVLAEALAQMTTVLAFAVQQVPEVLLEQLLRLYGVRRDPGSPTKAVARIEVSGGHPMYTIPAGTLLRLELESTGESIDFTTDGSLEIRTDEGTTARQAITAVDPGTDFNDLPAGHSVTVVDSLPFIESVRLDSPTSGGRDEETDQSFQSRAAALLGRLVSTLVIPEHFRLAALELASVGRAREIDLHDPAQPDNPEAIGHITVFVTDRAGRALTASDRASVVESLRRQAMASLIVHVEDPSYTELSIAVEVEAHPEANPEAVRSAVETRLRAWLSPAQWNWGSSVTQFGIVTQAAGAPGVAHVRTASETTELSGIAPLPDLQDVTVTVIQASR